jgi:hypothetical protein
MTQESALTQGEIEAMDRDLGAPSQEPAPAQPDADGSTERPTVRPQESEAKS